MIPVSHVRAPDPELGDVVVVSGCDQAYFPLAKGLFSSLLPWARSMGLRLAFVDVGCDQESIAWLLACGVDVRKLDPGLLKDLRGKASGGHHAQICRPFLPEIFPDAPIIAWMDADMWVQDLNGFHAILNASARLRDEIFVSPEQHFTYSHVINSEARRKEIAELNEPIFGSAVASEMQKRPVYNTGFFIASRSHPFWREWSKTVMDIYVDRADRIPYPALHFAEQCAFNYVGIRTNSDFHHIDPVYNYLCLWKMPFRDEEGTVRLSATPASPVGILHLAGGWRFFGRRYLRAKLLYGNGENLSPGEIDALRNFSAASHRYGRT